MAHVGPGSWEGCQPGRNFVPASPARVTRHFVLLPHNRSWPSAGLWAGQQPIGGLNLGVRACVRSVSHVKVLIAGLLSLLFLFLFLKVCVQR